MWRDSILLFDIERAIHTYTLYSFVHSFNSTIYVFLLDIKLIAISYDNLFFAPEWQVKSQK